MASNALLAGTLCLMSCYARQPRAEFGWKIVENLESLSREPGFSAELRTVCSRLAGQWKHVVGAEHGSTTRSGQPASVH
jgi:hypothetical protein